MLNNINLTVSISYSFTNKHIFSLLAEFEDDLLQTSNQLNMFRYPPIDDRRGQKSPRLSSVLGRPNSIERDSQETSENRELSKPSEDIRTETEGPNPRPVRPYDEPSRNPVVDHSRGSPKEVPERKLQLHSLGQQIIDPPNDQPDDTRDFLNRPQKIHNLLQLNKQLQLKPDSSYGRLDPTSKRPDRLREVNTPGHSLRISRNQFEQSERPVRQPESPFRYSERLPDLHETAETDLVNGKQQIDNDDTNRTKFSARERSTDYPSDRSQRPLPPINKSIERPLNFFELYQFVDKPLRPHEMAQVCSSSKQESFLFTIDQFLLILKKLEKGNPSVTIKEASILEGH